MSNEISTIYIKNREESPDSPTSAFQNLKPRKWLHSLTGSARLSYFSVMMLKWTLVIRAAIILGFLTVKALKLAVLVYFN